MSRPETPPTPACKHGGETPDMSEIERIVSDPFWIKESEISIMLLMGVTTNIVSCDCASKLGAKPVPNGVSESFEKFFSSLPVMDRCVVA
tara:strand:+ start:188 stop:457 length:270 start_codon:yes stop_codon:yes gene_type:complete